MSRSLNRRSMQTRRKRKGSRWHKTTPETLFLPMVPEGSSVTWFVTKSKRYLWGTITGNKQDTKFHLQLFRTKTEREHYWEGSDTSWDLRRTRFFRLKNPIKVDPHGQWWIHRTH